MYPLFFFIYVMVFIIAALIICLFQEVHYVLIQWYIFNIVWRYTYSIRLFLIEAKHRYRGKNINRKHTLKYSKFKSNVIHKAFSFGVAPSSSHWIRSSAINERTSVLAQQTTTLLFCGWCKKCICLNQKLRPILRWLCWFKSSGSGCRGGSRVASSVTQVWRFSPANQWSAEFYTSRFGNGTARMEPWPSGY